jgi:hypothetical protein
VLRNTLPRYEVFRASREDLQNCCAFRARSDWHADFVICDSAVQFRFATHPRPFLRASACFALCLCCTRTCPKCRRCTNFSVLAPLYMINRNKLAKHCVLDALSQTSYLLSHYDDDSSSQSVGVHAPKRLYILKQASCFSMIRAMPFFFYCLLN